MPNSRDLRLPRLGSPLDPGSTASEVYVPMGPGSTASEVYVLHKGRLLFFTDGDTHVPSSHIHAIAAERLPGTTPNRQNFSPNCVTEQPT